MSTPTMNERIVALHDLLVMADLAQRPGQRLTTAMMRTSIREVAHAEHARWAIAGWTMQPLEPLEAPQKASQRVEARLE